eukprot:4472833-Amphidinium_carterae.1
MDINLLDATDTTLDDCTNLYTTMQDMNFHAIFAEAFALPMLLEAKVMTGLHHPSEAGCSLGPGHHSLPSIGNTTVLLHLPLLHGLIVQQSDTMVYCRGEFARLFSATPRPSRCVSLEAGGLLSMVASATSLTNRDTTHMTKQKDFARVDLPTDNED